MLVKHASGMAYVPMYAAYEYSLNRAFAAAVQHVDSLAIPLCDLQPELLAIALDPLLKAVRTTGENNVWLKRLELFQKATCLETAVLDKVAMPHDGSHYKRTQLELFWAVFRLPGAIVPDPRLFDLPDELCDRRNAVAHGRRTAEDVGREKSPREILDRFAQTNQLCLHVLQSVASRCSDTAAFRR